MLAGAGTVGLEIEEDAPDADAVVVPVGGGGLVGGHRGRARRTARCASIAVEPETSPALHAGHRGRRARPGRRRARSPTASTRRSPGALAIELCRDLERVLVTEEEIEQAFRFLYERAKLACEPAGAAAAAALLAGKVEAERPVAVVSGGNVAGADRLWYPGFAMKADIHPEYVFATVHCSCGNSFVTRSTSPELNVEICAQCHPFYTGKQKLVDTGGRVERFQRRLEKAGRAAPSAAPKPWHRQSAARPSSRAS